MSSGTFLPPREGLFPLGSKARSVGHYLGCVRVATLRHVVLLMIDEKYTGS